MMITTSFPRKRESSAAQFLDPRLKHSGMTVGQSIVEFAFAMIVVVFLIYGMVRLFFWTGMDLASRRFANDNSLIVTTPTASTILRHNIWNPSTGRIENEYGTVIDPSVQLNPSFYRVQPMRAIYNGSITNEGA